MANLEEARVQPLPLDLEDGFRFFTVRDNGKYQYTALVTLESRRNLAKKRFTWREPIHLSWSSHYHDNLDNLPTWHDRMPDSTTLSTFVPIAEQWFSFDGMESLARTTWTTVGWTANTPTLHQKTLTYSEVSQSAGTNRAFNLNISSVALFYEEDLVMIP